MACDKALPGYGVIETIASVVLLMVFAEWFMWRMFHLADGVCLQLAYSARRFVLSVVVFFCLEGYILGFFDM